MHGPSTGTDAPRIGLLTLAALGVVYGDIGTSPLYAFRESLRPESGLGVDTANVLGILSLIFWSLILVITVKYLLFVMRADDDGEGGILALTSLISPEDRRAGSGPWRLILIGLFGTALLYGDGMITPSISVLSAVEGLAVVTPELEPWVIPVAVAILIGLFSIQRHGTAAVGSVFGPVMVVWFTVLSVLGVSGILRHPVVLTAVDPTHAVAMFASHPTQSFLALGSVFLVVTGAEALYADMGHFGTTPIRLGWLGLVLPALLLNYFGQGGSLIEDPTVIDNPFFLMAPAPLRVPLVVLATLATVIASQALISGVFSLTMQATRLGYLPRLRIDHTSDSAYGQVYVPAANWTLMVACIGLVIGFGSSSALAAAYGVAVTTTMVITTTLFAAVARRRWGWSRTRAGIVVVAFLMVDLAYFGANLFKIPAGGWFPLIIGLLVFGVMTTWKRGRQIVADGLRAGRLSAEAFVQEIADAGITRVPGTGVYMFGIEGATPPTLLQNLRSNHVLHDVVAFLTVRVTNRPRVHPAERAQVRSLGSGFFAITVHFGYREDPNVPRALESLVNRDIGFDALHTTYFVGHETLIVRPEGVMHPTRERLFAFLARNVGPAAQYFGLPPERVVEIGTQLEI